MPQKRASKRPGKRVRPKIKNMSDTESTLTSFRDESYLKSVLPVFLGDAGSPSVFTFKHPLVLHIGTEATPSIQVTDFDEPVNFEQTVCTAYDDLHISTQDIVQAQWEKVNPKLKLNATGLQVPQRRAKASNIFTALHKHRASWVSLVRHGSITTAQADDGDITARKKTMTECRMDSKEELFRTHLERSERLSLAPDRDTQDAVANTQEMTQVIEKSASKQPFRRHKSTSVVWEL